MKLNIGQKLGLSAAISIVLLVALVGLSHLSFNRIGDATMALERANTIAEALEHNRLDLIRMRAAYLDVRLAESPEALDKIVAQFDPILARSAASIDQIAATSALAANRERMARAKGLLDEYGKGWRAIAAIQRDVLLAQGRVIAAVDAWRQASANLKQASGRAGEDAVAMTERVLGDVAEARANLWRWIAVDDPALRERVVKALESAAADLKRMEGFIGMAAPAKEAAVVVKQFSDVATTIATAFETRKAMVAKAGVQRAEVNTLMEDAATAADELSKRTNTLVQDTMASAQTSGLALGAAVVLVLIGSALFGALAIGKPIRKVAGVLERLAGGDRTVDIPYVKRGDEVGETARAAEVFKGNLIRMEQLAAEQKEAEARAEATKKATLRELADTFERAVGGIVDTVSAASGQLKSSAESMAAAAQETTHQSTVVAAASEEATSNVHTVASAAEELAASVGEIGRRVNESARIAGEAARDADATAEKVGRLSQAAQKIGDIVGLISTIAGQTNLLALNATIEAARAGEAGRGFAVVASEVKSLADQTARATAEISGQIEAIQSSTAESATAIGGITEIIRRMNEIATTIASAVEEQGAATGEIARNVQQASAGTAEVSSNIVGVSKAAADSASSSEQVLAAAGSLATQSAMLKREVDKFLGTIRAA